MPFGAIFMRFILFLAALLTACGGGGAGEPVQPVITMYGDSLTSGPSLAEKPAARLNELLGGRYSVQARAVAGATISQSLDAHPNGAIVWQWLPFTEQLRQDHPSIILLRWGGSDAVAATDPQSFRASLTQATRQAKAAGTVYLIGVISTALFVEASAITDRINQEVAAAEGVTYINLRDLPFNAAQDILPGDVHPTQGYSDRIMARVAEQLCKAGC